MAIDNIQYEDAAENMKEVFTANRRGLTMVLPLEVGFVLFAGLSMVCFPLVSLVFHFETSQAFADFVMASYDEIPETGRWREHGLANMGSWSWTWMEPIICAFSNSAAAQPDEEARPSAVYKLDPVTPREPAGGAVPTIHTEHRQGLWAVAAAARAQVQSAGEEMVNIRQSCMRD